MHNEIDYSSLTGYDKQQKALNDIKDYVGEAEFLEKVTLLVELVAQKEASPEHICNMFGMFVGISGYPLDALAIELVALQFDNSNYFAVNEQQDGDFTIIYR